MLSASSFTGSAVLARPARGPRPAAARVAPAPVRALTQPLRSYTVRSGDSLGSIAAKRGLTVADIKKLNPHHASDSIVAGQHLLLPSTKLSSRDREILDGLHPGGLREYPVRAGETIVAIAANRNTTVQAIQKANPGKDLSKALPAGTKVLLPPGAFSIREREWLQGAGIVPAEFFGGRPAGSAFALGSAVLVLVAAAGIWLTCNKDNK